MILGAGVLVVTAQLSVATSEAALSTPPYLPAISPTDVDAGSPLLVAAEPFETLTEMAFSVPGLRLDSAIAIADQAAKRARGSLPQASAAQLDARLAEVHQAYKSDDRPTLAISSVEAYRILVSAARPGKVPTAVKLLDYAGLRYDADFQAMPIRWPDMTEAAAYAHEQWSSISDEITDPALRERVDAAVTDMGLGAEEQNTFKARRSVTAALELVDELEGYFTNR
jgi:hypothetical protein